MTPLGLSRTQAAEYVGIGSTKFDELVSDGMMPRPKVIGSRKLWERREIEMSFDNLPVDGNNDWDEV